MRMWMFLACVAASRVGWAQVMLANPTPTPMDATGQPDTLATLRSASLLLVEPPKPKDFKVHDKVSIVISETSKQSSAQTIDTKKDETFQAALNRFPDLAKLLEAQFASTRGSPITGVDLSHSNKYKGEGKYDRSDRFSDKITATIIDVKPNGTLVLEAKRVIQKDDEKQTLVLSGECRREDVTTDNTVLSSQLAELTLITRHEGRVKEAAEKGLIPRIFEAIFNF